ncbi:OmpA family protein [Halarcobacter ebronensis]|nr:OmpA family protein [Halarcobacter ebronensis]QKF83116.1 OmpA domain-containing protein [Halarcobacter ebronensis]
MKKNTMKKATVVLLTSTILFTGCAQKDPERYNNYENTQKGVGIGAFLGALIGAVASGGNHAKGAVIGGVVGGALGGTIGYSMDEQAGQIAKELDEKVDNTPQAVVNPDNDIVISNTQKYVKIMLRDKMVFDTNSSIPTQEAARKIEKISNVLTKYPDTIVQVVGFTDSRGTYEYNQKLSEQRAKSVGDIFYNNGIQNQIYSKGCSYNKPIVPNKTKEDMALNRRVEIYLYPNTESVIDTCSNQ